MKHALTTDDLPQSKTSTTLFNAKRIATVMVDATIEGEELNLVIRDDHKTLAGVALRDFEALELGMVFAKAARSPECPFLLVALPNPAYGPSEEHETVNDIATYWKEAREAVENARNIIRAMEDRLSR